MCRPTPIRHHHHERRTWPAVVHPHLARLDDLNEMVARASKVVLIRSDVPGNTR